MVEMLRTWEERTNATWALERVPPTSPLFIDELGEFEVSKTTLRKDKNPHCPICLERLAVGDMATRLPCRHLYHYECLLPWLQRSNLCALCRHRLPTLDADHEAAVRSHAQQASAPSSSESTMYL